MCGIIGILDLKNKRHISPSLVYKMLQKLEHRGPDSSNVWNYRSVGFGIQRLAIIDPVGGEQPLTNESKSIITVANGEIFNYRELRSELKKKGYNFSTNGDIEVIPHLFEEYGTGFVEKLNGQFAIAIYDKKKNEFHLLRDHFGIVPLFYTVVNDFLIFGSEIKAILEHPLVPRELNLQALDQLICFPGTVSPETMFQGIKSLRPGHRLIVQKGKVTEVEYWDLNYPTDCSEYSQMDEQEYAEHFLSLFDNSVKLRMRSDVPVGVYLSGGIDSSAVADSMRSLYPNKEINSFSMVFPGSKQINELPYQRLLAKKAGTKHKEVPFNEEDTAKQLEQMIWHAEIPVKETYNVCSMALSQAAHESGVKVILGGEGADELLGGYPGYRFDQFSSSSQDINKLEPDEKMAREQVLGNSSFKYERNYHQFAKSRTRFFSEEVQAILPSFDCLAKPIVNPERLINRHILHQRSYFDIKLRLADHLLGDHGDRMIMSNSVEGRYPFLDPDLVSFLINTPPEIKLKGLTEKHLLKKAMQNRLPHQIIKRQKFGFRAPGSIFLLKMNLEWVSDLLSSERLKQQGYLNVPFLENLIKEIKQSSIEKNPHLDDDLVLIALTLSIFIDLFNIPSF